MSSRISKLVHDLVQQISSASTSDHGGISQQVDFAMHVITSNFGEKALSVQDEDKLVQELKRCLIQRGGNSEGLDFAGLHRKLALLTQHSASFRLSILQLLDSIARDQDMNSRYTDRESRQHGFTATSQPRRLTSQTTSSELSDSIAARLNIAVSEQPGSSSQRSNQGHLSDSLAQSMSQANADPAGSRKPGQGQSGENGVEVEEVAEAELVRDVLFTCEGIDGHHVKFDQRADKYLLSKSCKVSQATRTLVQQLCEVGRLYRQLHSHVLSTMQTGSSSAGVVRQAFVSVLQQELAQFYRLLSVLETQAHHPIPSAGSGQQLGGDHVPPSSRPYLTLLRLKVWLAEPLVCMRQLASLVELARTHKGGALAGRIHSQTQNGNPPERALAERVLAGCCTPLLDMVRRWVLEGDLRDPYSEFFVVADPGVSSDNFWRLAYRQVPPYSSPVSPLARLQEDMVPSFISSDLAARILRTGKSINFLRKCCNDQEWPEAAAAAVMAASAKQEAEGATTELEALALLVEEASQQIDAHLVKVMFKKYHFMRHCEAIRRYLLHSQGDFIQLLIAYVGPELDQPLDQISIFKLSSKLDMAVRGSLAQYEDPAILDCLKVGPITSSLSRSGWDAFSLRYLVQPPLTAVFTPPAMEHYLRIFNLLWRIQRVDHALAATWHTMAAERPARVKNDATSSSSFSSRSPPSSAPLSRSSSVRSSYSHHGGGVRGSRSSMVSNDGAAPLSVASVGRSGLEDHPEFDGLLKSYELLRSEMAHFVGNVRIYFVLEVMENNRADFAAKAEARVVGLPAVQVAKGLDELIEAHELYIQAVVEKALLGECSQLLRKVLYTLFDHILTFTAMVADAYSKIRDVRAQLSSRQANSLLPSPGSCPRAKRAAEAEKRTAAGQWGTVAADGPQPHVAREFLAKAQKEMEGLKQQYASDLEGFIAQLPAQQHVDLRFLSLRLDFSLFYTRQHTSSSNPPLKLRRTPPPKTLA
eukprot:jgi/Mesen1/11044/ME000099S10486